MAQTLNASRTHMGRSMSPRKACKLLGRMKDWSQESWGLGSSCGSGLDKLRDGQAEYVRIINTKSSPSFSPAELSLQILGRSSCVFLTFQLSRLPWCTFLSSCLPQCPVWAALVTSSLSTQMDSYEWTFCCFLSCLQAMPATYFSSLFFVTPW